MTVPGSAKVKREARLMYLFPIKSFRTVRKAITIPKMPAIGVAMIASVTAFLSGLIPIEKI